MSRLTAKDVMNRNIISVSEEWPLSKLARIFLDKNISGAPVVDASNQITGVVSAMDVVRSEAVTNHEIYKDLSAGYYLHEWEDQVSMDEFSRFHVEEENEKTVGQIMTPMVFKTDVDTPVSELASMMVHGRIHRVLITEKEKVVGIVSALDLVALLEEPKK